MSLVEQGDSRAKGADALAVQEPVVATADAPSIEQIAQGLPELSRDEAFESLSVLLRTHPSAEVRESAAYGLSWLGEDRVVRVLIEATQDREQAIRVRAQATEGIGIILMCSDRRRRLFKQAVQALLPLLRDETPEVRFWACYALMVMRATAALDELRRVAATDQAHCPGWWLVGEEAADAITTILGGNPPHRVPRPVRDAATAEAPQG